MDIVKRIAIVVQEQCISRASLLQGRVASIARQRLHLGLLV